MGTLKVLSVVLLLLGCISPTVPQTPDENQADDPSTTRSPTVSPSPLPSPTNVTCVNATFLQGLKLESGVGLVVRIFENKIWLEGVDYSDGYPNPMGDSSPPTPPPITTTRPPSNVTLDDRK